MPLRCERILRLMGIEFLVVGRLLFLGPNCLGREFTPEYKDEAVKLVVTTSRQVETVALA